MESAIVGFLILAVILGSIAWFVWLLGKSIRRWLSASKHRDVQTDTLDGNVDRPFRFPPPADVASVPSQSDYRLVPFSTEDGQGSGYVVERVDDGQRLAWDFLTIRGEGMESLGVAGETHHREDLQAASFRPPARLTLVPEPTNRYDPHAVAVWDAATRHQAGYIPGSESKRIAGRLRKGQVADCLSIWETIVNGERVSLRILLLDKKARLRPVSKESGA